MIAFVNMLTGGVVRTGGGSSEGTDQASSVITAMLFPLHEDEQRRKANGKRQMQYTRPMKQQELSRKHPNEFWILTLSALFLT